MRLPSFDRPGVRVMALGAAVAVPAGLAYRFAVEYRRRAGVPHPHPVSITPDDLRMPYEDVAIPSGLSNLPGWFVPALASSPGERRPAVVVVHGWESNRGRALSYVRFLHAAGFHCLVFDVRGHGSNAAETLPMTGAEFGADAAAAARLVASRPDVTAVGLLGHSMGGVGALVAASIEPDIGAVVAVSTPADPVRLTRETFRMAGFRIPSPAAGPLAELTTRVFMAPRGHATDDASASAAAARYHGPLLLAHGADDSAVPAWHLDLIARAALRGRSPDAAAVETLILPGYGHRWLYEAPAFRRAVAGFLAAELHGPIDPDVAGDLAAHCVVTRPADTVDGFGALGGGPGSGRRPPGLTERPRPSRVND